MPATSRHFSMDGASTSRFTERYDWERSRRTRTCPSRSRFQHDLGGQLESEPAARTRDEANVRALLFETTTKQEEPALEIVLPFREVQGFVETQLAVGELGPTRGLVNGENPPEDLRRQTSNQVLAVHQDAFVGAVVYDVTFPFSGGGGYGSGRWWRRGRGRRHLGQDLGGTLAQLHVLDRNREVVAKEFDRGLVLFVEAIRHFALEAEHADELSPNEQRDAELTLWMGESGHGDAPQVTALATLR